MLRGRAERVVPDGRRVGRPGGIWRERGGGHGGAAGVCAADAPAGARQLCSAADAVGAGRIAGPQHLPAGLCQHRCLGQVWRLGGCHPSGLPALQPARLLRAPHLQVIGGPLRSSR